MSPAERRLSGIVHANRRVAAPGYDGRTATAAARHARTEHLRQQVDPAGTLDPATVARKVKALRKAQLAEGRLAKLQGRPARKITAGSVTSWDLEISLKESTDAATS